MTTRTISLAPVRARPGFTLAEMLVAVAALALLSLGVAQIFSLTTRTVAAGRKLSNLNATASAVERQMRADFSRMTSRGVMVIRNERANAGNTVDLYAADPLPRVRRVDEILFSATGRFSSERQPVTVGGQPVSSGEAMIYYGHGTRQEPTAAGATGFSNPVNIGDTNAAAPPLGVPLGAGGSKVNLYASEWTLARRAFLLSTPNLGARYNAAAGQGLATGVAGDSAYEIGGLPAVPSPSRGDSLNWSSDSTTFNTLRGGVQPRLSSGAIDIIAMDLRAVIGQLSDMSTVNWGNPRYQSLTAQNNPVGLTANAFNNMTFQQYWLRSLLPADSDAGLRMRVEPAAPDLLNAGGGSPNLYQRTDQLMLTSGAFLPRCSEFIVEYSFGLARRPSDPGGQLSNVYWHGLERRTGYNTGGIDLASDVVRYEDYVTSGGRPAGQLVYRRPMPGTSAFTARTVNADFGMIEPQFLGAWYDGIDWQYNGRSSYALFGVNDPLYSPIPNSGNTPMVKDVDGDGRYDWADGDILADPESIPWKWPTMIRITLTIADPTDPSIEETFQFVFDVPNDQRGKGM